MLKKTIIGILNLGLLFAIILPSIISCKTTHAQIKSPKVYHSKIPIESFAFITIIKDIEPTGCKKQKKLEECKKLLEKLPIVSSRSTGSGMLMAHNGKRFVITAAHVCQTPDIKETVYQGFKINLKSTNRIQMTFSGGKTFITKIAHLDTDHDICILLPPKKSISPQPVYLAKKPPEKGDKIYNIAAPLGIFGDNLTLVFEGRYSGKNRGMHYYTVPARPGSSGSVVLNKNYRVVGTVNIAVTHLESVGIGTGWEDLKSILDKIR